MHPTLFTLGRVPVGSYGTLMAAGILAGVLLAVRSGRRRGIPTERMLDLLFWVLVSSFLGARLVHLLTEAGSYYRRCAGQGAPRGPGQVLQDCTAALRLWEGGLVFYGAPIGAALAALWTCRRHHLSFLQVADLLAPLVALAHAFGRLGCLCAGCCYGRPSSTALGLAFPPASVAFREMQRDGLLEPGALATGPLHPTQLYEALAELAIAATLVLLGRRQRPRGSVALAYVALYALVRFVIELFRADPDRGYLFRLVTPGLSRWLGLPLDAPTLLSTSQAISLLLLGLALWGFWRTSHGATGGGAGGSIPWERWRESR